MMGMYPSELYKLFVPMVAGGMMGGDVRMSNSAPCTAA
jgi:hypothetical protein